MNPSVSEITVKRNIKEKKGKEELYEVKSKSIDLYASPHELFSSQNP